MYTHSIKWEHMTIMLNVVVFIVSFHATCLTSLQIQYNKFAVQISLSYDGIRAQYTCVQTGIVKNWIVLKKFQLPTSPHPNRLCLHHKCSTSLQIHQFFCLI